MEKKVGTDAKQDAVVTVSDTAADLQVEIRSPLEDLFGKSLEKAAREELSRLNVRNGTVLIEDNQALDFVIRARIKAAVSILREMGGEI